MKSVPIRSRDTCSHQKACKNSVRIPFARRPSKIIESLDAISAESQLTTRDPRSGFAVMIQPEFNIPVQGYQYTSTCTINFHLGLIESHDS